MPRIFLQSTHAILTEYEKPPDPASKPTIELKAVVEPRLTSARTTVMDKEKRIALRGIGVPMVTIFVCQQVSTSHWSAQKAHLSEPSREG